MEKKSNLVRHGTAAAIYLFLIVLFYSPVVFGGKTLLPSLYQPHGILSEGLYDKNGRTPENSFNIDIATPAYYESPLNKLTGDLYKKGELPLWNPYQAIGTPLAAQYSTRVFFPYQILEDISPWWTWDFYLLGRLLFAGFFTYLFLDLLGISFIAALAGGAFYMLQGTFVWFINLEQLTNVAMVVPLVMYATERLATAPKRIRESLPQIALLGISIGMMLLAGQPEVALYSSLLSFLYFTLRTKGRGLVAYWLKYAFSYGVGLFAAMPLLLPFLELASAGYHIHPSGGEMGRQVLQHWQTVFAQLTPTVTEFPAQPEMISGVVLLVKIKDSFFRFLPINGVWDTLGGYTGIALIFIVLSGALYASFTSSFKFRAQLLFFAAFGFAIIFKNIGVLPFSWLGRLPLFDQVWTLRWASPAWAFSFAAAGAVSLELFAAKRLNPEHIIPSASVSSIGGYFRKRPHMAPTIVFLLLLVVYFFFSFQTVIGLTMGRDFYFSQEMRPFVVPSMFVGSILTIFVLFIALLIISSCMNGRKSGITALFSIVVLELWWAVPRGYDTAFLMYKLVPFSIGFAAVALFFFDLKKIASAAIILFLAASFIMDSYSPKGWPERKDPFSESEYIGFLRNNLGEMRATGAYGALFPNFASAAGINDIRYVNSILPATYQSYRSNYLHVDKIDEGPSSALWFSGRPERCRAKNTTAEGNKVYQFWLRPVEEDIAENLRSYSILGLKYLVLPSEKLEGAEMPQNASSRLDAFAKVYDKDVRIYENPQATDRAFVAYSYELSGSFEDAQRLAVSGKADPRQKIVLEESPGIQTAAPGSYKLKITNYSANHVTIEADTDRDGVLVLTDLHYPGWEVHVNGIKAKPLRVDGLVRGVVVRKGFNKVEFSYCPVSFKVGLLAFAAALVFCALAFIKGSRKS